MASYDPRSDKIYGCKKDSLTWWHERGHQVLFQNGITSEKDIGISFAILLGWGFLVMKQNTYSMWCLFFVLFLILGEEIYCWIYGLIKYSQTKPKTK